MHLASQQDLQNCTHHYIFQADHHSWKHSQLNTICTSCESEDCSNLGADSKINTITNFASQLWPPAAPGMPSLLSSIGQGQLTSVQVLLQKQMLRLPVFEPSACTPSAQLRYPADPSSSLSKSQILGFHRCFQKQLLSSQSRCLLPHQLCQKQIPVRIGAAPVRPLPQLSEAVEEGYLVALLS